MPNLDAILGDLESEHAALDTLVAGIDAAGWDEPTPAEGWSIKDQIGHLAFFDEQATLALSDAEGFAENLREMAKDIGGFMDRSVARGRELDRDGVLEWWRSARSEMLTAAHKIEPSVRIPWYGPPMSPASFVSARQMETWAHGQDVADTLGVIRDDGDRLRNVAHICVLSRRHSYDNRGLEVPEAGVRVELTSPGGETWTWGEGEDRIAGTATEFCLVVTQRRHPADTDLVIEGPHARGWMEIAQAYAGPPGPGRLPGQFPKQGPVPG